MVIADIREVERRIDYVCFWFNGRTVEAAIFHAELLDYPQVDIINEYFI